MAELQQDLAKAGVVLALVVVPVKHHADLERMGLIDLIGCNQIFESRHACVAAYTSESYLWPDSVWNQKEGQLATSASPLTVDLDRDAAIPSNK
jgi:hypothetical protein